MPDPLADRLTRALVSHNFADADTCACGVEYDGQMTYERHQAEVYLAAITATGRLLNGGAVVIATTEAAGGFDADEEWGVRTTLAGHITHHSAAPESTPWDHAEATAYLADWLEAHPDGAGHFVRRTVYTGPWEAVDDHA